MIVIPPDTFERWKNIMVQDKNLSDLDQKMKKILYNNKLNDVDKWHLYRQNLLKYLNAKQEQRQNISNLTKSPVITEAQKKYLSDMNTQTESVNKKHKNVQTLPTDQKSISSQTPTIDEVFETSDVFSNSNNEADNPNDEDEMIELDVSDIVREKALEGFPPSVKISRERKSFDRGDYRSYDLTNDIIATVPVERQMVTRGTIKNVPGTSQTTIDFPKRRNTRQASSSTPTKLAKKSTIPWKSYK